MTTLIIGASSKIAQATAQTIRQHSDEKLLLVSRNQPDYIDELTNVDFWPSNYEDSQVESICQSLKQDELLPDRVIICNGLLHNDNVFPEKQLRELDRDQWLTLMLVNAWIPMAWLQNLAAIMSSKHKADIAIFSARVGSISDNRLGGWYSYRASKASLNMMVKSASLELKRTHPNLALMLFHPGTTDTPLSKPFQQRVPEGKLFEPDFVAQQLLKIMGSELKAGELKFLDWAGEAISF
jgi:NAD(P)-dependent dehydrogenase (short-subunit alcohol dehydrogenase family)